MPLTKSRTFRRRAAAAAAVFTGLAFAGCTLLGAREVVQCTRDEECPTTRPACVARLCTARTIDGGDVDGDVDVAPPACVSPRDCDQQAAKTTCVDGQCRRLTSTTCPVLLPANTSYQEDGAIIVGVYLQDPVNTFARFAVESALEEIQRAIPQPRVLALLCAKPADAKAKRNVDDVLGELAALRIPLLVGPFEHTELVRIVGDARAKNIAIWSTLANHPTQRPPNLPSQGIYRFLLDELKNTRDAYQKALDYAVLRAGQVHEADLTGSVKVALVSNTSPDVQELADALAAELELDGVALESLLDARFRRFSVEPLFERPEYSYATAINAIRADFQPHVVIGVGGDEIVQRVVLGIEEDWGQSARPVYVLSARSKYNGSSFLELGQKPSGRARMIGVDFAGDRDEHAAFVDGIRGHAPHVRAFDIFYDAMHAVALAAVVADGYRRERGEPRAPVTFEDLTRGLDSLAGADAGAQVVGVGSGQLLTAADFLRQGTEVHFRGTTGPWTFEAATGSRRMGTSFFCFPGAGDTLELYVDPAASLATVCKAP